MKPALKRAATVFRKKKPLSDQSLEGLEKKSKKRMRFKFGRKGGAEPGPSTAVCSPSSVRGDLVEETLSVATTEQPSATMNEEKATECSSKPKQCRKNPRPLMALSESSDKEELLEDPLPPHLEDRSKPEEFISLSDSSARLEFPHTLTTPVILQATPNSSAFSGALNTTVQAFEATTAGGNVQRNQTILNAPLFNFSLVLHGIPVERGKVGEPRTLGVLPPIYFGLFFFSPIPVPGLPPSQSLPRSFNANGIKQCVN
ncbi:hypothetical protein NMY22_g4908 [Coprinellus aureogranulatus]|nr:hypothetical protein NMY22_g4908 [Coprinellus aureogranulatus]